MDIRLVSYELQGIPSEIRQLGGILRTTAASGGRCPMGHRAWSQGVGADHPVTLTFEPVHIDTNLSFTVEERWGNAPLVI